MQRCANCGHENPDGLPVCLNCACALGTVCPACGKPVQDDDHFCRSCGERLGEAARNPAASPAARLELQERLLANLRAGMPLSMARKIDQYENRLAGHRRDITIVSIDLGGLALFPGHSDPESAFLLTDAVVHLLAETIYTYEGIIDRFTGDSLVALFGLPINHENDPERAVRAALEILESLRSFRPVGEGWPEGLPVRIGINTGIVVAGSLNSQRHIEYTVIGDTVFLATRLQQLAAPGTALVSFQTYQRTRPIFEYEPLDPLPLTGYQDALARYRVLQLRTCPGQVRGLPGMQAPMVGREQDFNRLLAGLKRVRETESGNVVFISGSAGIGKSRLVAEFKNALAGEPVSCHLGTCASYMRVAPLRVVTDIFRRILRLTNIDPPAVQREALQAGLKQLGLEEQDLFLYLLHILGLGQDDPVSEVRIRLLDPAMLQRQLHWAMRTYLLAQAQTQPAVLIFDDLHWVDPVSLSFLSYFSQSLENVPILLVLISRDFEQDPGTRQLAEDVKKRLPQPIHIRLEPLPAPDARLLLDQFIPQDYPEYAQIKERIIERAQGSPYYTEELVRILIDHAGLVYQDGAWVLAPPAAELVEQVPGTLQDIFLARFDRLDPAHQRLLQLISALRVPKSAGFLQALHGSPQETQAGLDLLVEHDFLSFETLHGQPYYRFKHPLLQETIYNTLLHRNARELHLRLARLLSTPGGPPGSALEGDLNELLAFHYSESTQPELAIPYLLEAAEAAEKQFANETAIQYHRLALELLDKQPNPPARQVTRARIGLGKALKFTGSFEDATQAIEPAISDLFQAPPDELRRSGPWLALLLDGLRELADIRAREGKLDLSIKLLEHGLGLLGEEPVGMFSDEGRRLADRLSWVFFRYGRLEEAFQLADMALVDERRWEADDPITLASLCNTIGGILYMRSRPAEAAVYVERSLQIYQGLCYQWGMAIAYTNLGVLQHAQGKWVAAVASLEQADQIRSQHGYAPERPVNLRNLGEVLMLMGDLPRAREKLQTSLEISRSLGMELFIAYAELGLCGLSILEKNLPEAGDHLAQARKLLGGAGDEVDDRMLKAINLEAMIEIERGHPQKALDLASAAQQQALTGGFLIERIDALRIMGSACQLMGLFDVAETHLKKSIEYAQSQVDPYHEGQALYTLGLTYALQATTGECDLERQNELLDLARGILHKAIDIFSELGAAHDLALAQAAHNHIPVRRSLAFSADGLDETQREVHHVRRTLGLAEGEWYQAAVVHVHLIPETGLGAQMAYEMLALMIPVLADIAGELQGEHIREDNNLVMVFGVPAAHENDTERAVEAAIQAINFYQELYKQTEIPLTIRIGIAHGKIVGGFLQSLQQNNFVAAGEPLLEARKLAEVATTGRVWVTPPVRNATAYIYQYSPILTDLGGQPGITQPMQLEGLRDQIEPVRGLLGLRSPFIGRRPELQQMQAMSAGLGQRTGGIIFLEGEPGIGKSRLMNEFTGALDLPGAITWRGACSPRARKHAFALFSSLVLNCFDIQPNDQPAQVYHKITTTMVQWPPEALELQPFLEVLAGVRPSGEEGERLLHLEPEPFRRQAFVALRRILAILSERHPIVLLLDDLQWIDPVSADLVLFLCNLVITTPVLFVCTHRSTEESSMLGTLARLAKLHASRFLRLPLLPLSLEESRALLGVFLSHANLPTEVHELIVRQSGGNPYFIEEFVRMLLEQDYLRINRGRIEANQVFAINSLSIPTSLETLIRARVDALPPNTRRLIQVASIIGQSFTQQLLAQVSEEEQVDRHLELLQARGMIRPGESQRWEFTHQLIETIVYNTVLKGQRQIIHQRTAYALEQQWQANQTAHAAELAYHFKQAGVRSKALAYLVLAGELAAARYANEEAQHAFQEASQLVSELPDTDAILRWRIACGLGEVYQFTGSFEASVQALKSGLQLVESGQLTRAHRVGLYRRLGETYLKMGEHDEAVRCFDDALNRLYPPISDVERYEAMRSLIRIGWSMFQQSRLERAMEITQRAWTMARQDLDLSMIAMAQNLMGGIFWRQGNLQQAVQHTWAAMDAWEQVGDSRGVASASANLGVLEAMACSWEAAERFFRKSLGLRQDMGDVEGVALMLNNLGMLLRDQGRFDEAEIQHRNSLAVARPFQITYHMITAMMNLAQALIPKGYLREAEELIQQGIEQAREMDAQGLLYELQRTQAELLLVQGRCADSVELAAQAAGAAGMIGEKILEASCWRVACDAQLEMQDSGGASQTLEKAIQAVAGEDQSLEAGRVYLQARKVYLQTGRLAEARQYDRLAAEIFTRAGIGYWLDQLRAVRLPFDGEQGPTAFATSE